MESTVLIIVISGLVIIMVILALALLTISRGQSGNIVNYHGYHLGHRSAPKTWRSDIIALITFLVMIIGIILALLFPEVRERLGLQPMNENTRSTPSTVQH